MKLYVLLDPEEDEPWKDFPAYFKPKVRAFTTLESAIRSRTSLMPRFAHAKDIRIVEFIIDKETL